MVKVRVRIKVRVSVRVKDFWRAWQENNGVWKVRALPIKIKLALIYFYYTDHIPYYFCVKYNVFYSLLL